MRPEAALGLGAALALALLLGACASPPPAHFPPTRIPGTRVSLVVPAGFELSQQFPGLVDAATRTSVMVSEVPHSAALVLDGMSAEALAARGSRLLGTETLSVDGRDAWLVDAEGGVAPDREVHRWILVVGAGDSAAVIAATAPQSLAGGLDALLRELLRSATWEPDRTLGPYEGLGFEIAETETLKLSDRLPRMVAFTRDGDRGALAPEDPLFLAGASAAPAAIADLAAFSHEQLRATSELAEVAVVSEGPLVLDGLPAYEIVANAVDGRSGAPLRVYQVLVVDGSEYFPLQGLVGADLAAEFMPQFRAIAHSFRRARPPDRP